MHRKLKKFKSCCYRRRFYYIGAHLSTSFVEFLLDCLRTYVLSVWLLTTYRIVFPKSFKILVISLNLYHFSTWNSYTRGLQVFDIFRETFLCIEMILTEMCHRSSSALRTWFYRGNDILKVSHQPTTIYERKNSMKGSAFNGMTSQAARGSRRWFPFHFTRLLLCSSVFIHRTNEPFQFWHLESIESLSPRISVLLLKKFIHLEKKKMKWSNNQLRNRTSSKFCPLSVEAIVSFPSFWQDSNDSLKLREEGDQKLLNAE